MLSPYGNIERSLTMTTYFKIKLSPESTLTQDIFNELLEDDLASINENGDYFGEKLKIKISETEVEFGYELPVAKRIFKKIFSLIKEDDIKEKLEYKFFSDFNFANQKAERFFSKRNHINKIDNNTIISSELPDQLSDLFFTQLFNEYALQGIIIGEEPHGQEESRKILVDYIETFKKCGVKAICLEAFIYKDSQNLIDGYLQSEKEKLPIELAAIADARNNPPHAPQLSYQKLLQFFKYHQIRVIALDHATSINHGIILHNTTFGERDSEFRIPSFNLYAKEIIKKEIPDGKYIAHVGSAHAYNCDALKVYSLKQLLPQTTNLIASAYGSKNETFFNYKETKRRPKEYPQYIEYEADIVVRYCKG